MFRYSIIFYENFGCDRIECFDQELLDEIKEEGIDVKPLVNDMLNWMIANNDKLKFSSQYHGSAETTPLYLIFKDYEVDIQHDIYNFTLPDGYDETADLITTLQAKFTNTSGNEITRESDGTATFTHVGQSDTATTASTM